MMNPEVGNWFYIREQTQVKGPRVPWIHQMNGYGKAVKCANVTGPVNNPEHRIVWFSDEATFAFAIDLHSLTKAKSWVAGPFSTRGEALRAGSEQVEQPSIADRIYARWDNPPIFQRQSPKSTQGVDPIDAHYDEQIQTILKDFEQRKLRRAALDKSLETAFKQEDPKCHWFVLLLGALGIVASSLYIMAVV